MFVGLFAYTVLGLVIIFFAQRFYKANLQKHFTKDGFIDKLISCRLCLGFWVYFVLACIFNAQSVKINVLDGFVYLPIITEVFDGMGFSFLAYLLVAGWKAEFTILQVGE